MWLRARDDVFVEGRDAAAPARGKAARVYLHPGQRGRPRQHTG